MARATIDLILNKDNPEELLKKNAKGAVIVKALEDNVKPKAKEKHARRKTKQKK